MNYSQSFEEFSSGIGPTDLALYAGIGVVLFILFKDKMSPVQKMLMDIFEKAKDTVNDLSQPQPVPVKVPTPNVVGPVPTPEVLVRPENKENDVFFQLVASWKQTRDLASKYKCQEAVNSLDNTFQYLSPTVCQGENNE